MPAKRDEHTALMKPFPEWDGQPYYPISRFYKNRFGEKVYKITVSAAQTCPNRENNKGVGCIFCDELGSAGSHLIKHMPLKTQITTNREKLKQRFKVNRFLVYFQPFTNTFKRLEQFKSDIELALDQDRVMGIVFGTRPDCLPDEIYPYLKEMGQQAYMSAELGVQSFSNQQLEFLNRGHTAEDSINAIERLHQESGINIGVHLIFGLPDETDQEIIDCAKIINSLPVDNVKLHNLHVLSKTPLDDLYQQGKFNPLELEEYARRVILFLSHLSPEIAVQRLAAVAPRWDELVAPDWTKERLRPTQFIIRQMNSQAAFQGIHLDSLS
jgi:uncharacterized protein